MNKELISIIVPIYNSSEYLDLCINSIRNQTYENLEIILIDDGSSDNSLKLCLYYAHQDSRIKVVKQKNQGQSVARNHALNLITGNYIYFADSDDYLESNLIEKMYNACKNTHADIAMCNFWRVFNGEKKSYQHELENNELIYNEKAMELLCKNEIIENFLWNKLFKAELWEKVRFPEGKLFEDYSVNHYLFNKANKTVFISDFLYNYVFRKESSIHNQKIEKEIVDLLDSKKERMDFIKIYYNQYMHLIYKDIVKSFMYIYHKIAKEGKIKEYRDILMKYETLILEDDLNKLVKDKDNEMFLFQREKYIKLIDKKYMVYRFIRKLYRKMK